MLSEKICFWLSSASSDPGKHDAGVPFPRMSELNASHCMISIKLPPLGSRTPSIPAPASVSLFPHICIHVVHSCVWLYFPICVYVCVRACVWLCQRFFIPHWTVLADSSSSFSLFCFPSHLLVWGVSALMHLSSSELSFCTEWPMLFRLEAYWRQSPKSIHSLWSTFKSDQRSTLLFSCLPLDRPEGALPGLPIFHYFSPPFPLILCHYFCFEPSFLLPFWSPCPSFVLFVFCVAKEKEWENTNQQIQHLL